MTGTATEGFGGDYFAIAPHGYAHVAHRRALPHLQRRQAVQRLPDRERDRARRARARHPRAARRRRVARRAARRAARARRRRTSSPASRSSSTTSSAPRPRPACASSEGDVLLVHTGRWRCRDGARPVERAPAPRRPRRVVPAVAARARRRGARLRRRVRRPAVAHPGRHRCRSTPSRSSRWACT